MASCLPAIGPRARSKAGSVFEVFVNGRSTTEAVSDRVVELAFRHGGLEFDRLRPGQQVWKTDDPELTIRLRKSFSGAPTRRVPIDVTAEAAVGQTLVIAARTDGGVECFAETAEPLELAQASADARVAR